VVLGRLDSAETPKLRSHEFLIKLLLPVGTLRDEGFTVIRDPEFPQKCLITDAPFENPNDGAQEHRLDQLAAMARIKHRCNYKRKKKTSW
jgi:hypothetical protein